METKAAQRAGPVGASAPTLPVTLAISCHLRVSDPVESRAHCLPLLPTQSGPGWKLGPEPAPWVASLSAQQGRSGDSISVYLSFPLTAAGKRCQAR